jgi:hypothetical protein
MRKLFTSLTLATMLVGCAAPSPKELESADYGPYPTYYEQIIKLHMQSVLKDPESARYQFLNTPTIAWDGSGGMKYGFVVCAYINSKNSFGGYVGNRMTYFMINSGRVTYVNRDDGEVKCRKFI